MPCHNSPTLNSILIVEGTDECHVVWRLCNRLEAMPDFDVVAKGGREKLLASIFSEVKAPGRSALGILLDANDHPNDRWRAVTDRLRKANVEAPATPDPFGVIIEGTPRIGIWMMPDNVSPGELEDFIAEMIPVGDAIWPLSQCYITNIPIADRKFRHKERRAQIHAWLAVREDPRPMGLAITAGDLDVNAEVCRRFADWLRTLFGE